MVRIDYWLIIILLSSFCFSCNGDDESGENSDDMLDVRVEKINLSNQLGLDSGEVKMFTMPTPLQISTALRVMNVDYNESLLLKNGSIAVSSDIDLSLALGMYLTDLGYTTVYSNSQKSLSFAKDIQFIMEELPITLYVNDSFTKRFTENIENRDSLCKIILDGYNDANQHITESENEALGLLILTGAYIEGLHLAASSNIPNIWLEEHDKLFIQQKLFLDNFIVLLDGYKSNSKIEEVIKNLSELKIAFNKVDIYFNNETDSYELRSPITLTTRNYMDLLIRRLRNRIIENIKIKGH